MAELSKATKSVQQARERANNAASKADMLTDQISLMKSASRRHDVSHSASFDDEQSIVSLIDEREVCIGTMDKAFSDRLTREAKTRQLSTLIEDLSRKLKLQAKAAASARRQADHSMSMADQMEEQGEITFLVLP